MKKRLLITSIVMMLVVAVALSTATYAWFTSNARVDAASITLKADTSNATALGIGWANGLASTSISANVSGTLKPMAPVALTEGTTTAGGGASDYVFKTQTTKNENGIYVFNAAGEDAAPVIFGNGSVNAFYVKNLSNANAIGSITLTAVFGADTNFSGDGYTYALTSDTTFQDGTVYYTKNASNTNVYEVATVTTGEAVTADTYYVRETISTGSLSANDLVRVAVFRRSATAAGDNKTYTSGDYKLIGVLGNANTAYTVVTDAYDLNKTYYTRTGEGTELSPYVYSQANISAFENEVTYYTAANTAVYGTITANGYAKNLANHEVTTSVELIDDGNLNPLGQVDLMVIVWLDGSKFDDTRAGEIASVSLKFNA